MKDPIDWTEMDVLSLIANQVQESVTLDYKRSEALAKSDSKKLELSKDVSAFANSAGGVILYGVEESNHIPTRIDFGLDPRDITREWIEQVINSSIYPKVDGLRINPIPLSSAANRRVVYAIYIPPATYRAPHQAKDKRYYKRYNFESVAMEDYEIRDVYRRATTPNLWISFSFVEGKSASAKFKNDLERSERIELRATIGNYSREPCFYSVVKLLFDKRLSIVRYGGFSPVAQAFMYDGISLNACYRNLSIPNTLPIFSEMTFSLFDTPFSFELDDAALRVAEFHIGYDIRAPGFSVTKLIRLVQNPPGTLLIADEHVTSQEML